jgi:transcriptional regulator with XRE-family HTH domain
MNGGLFMLKNYVRKYRQAAGMTMRDLAVRSGVPVSTIGGIEQGAEPRVVTAILIARALKVPVEKLWLL